MELLLNTAWLLVAALATVALLRNHHRNRRPGQLWLAAGVLLCTAFVLFPTISVSDDLHLDPFIVEDAKSTKRLAQAASRSHLTAPLWLVSIAFSTQHSFDHSGIGWQMVESRSSAYRETLLNRDLLGRAPPDSRLLPRRTV